MNHPRIFRKNTYNYTLYHICRVIGFQYLRHFCADQMRWCKDPRRYCISLPYRRGEKIILNVWLVQYRSQVEFGKY